MTLRVTRRRFLLGSAAFLGALAVDCLVVEPSSVSVEELSAGGPGLTLIQLSDLHLRGIGRREEEALRIIEEVDPDLVVITGDFVSDLSGLRPMETFLSELASWRVYGVLGNWDYWADPESVAKTAGDCGVRVLRNEWVREGPLTIVGVDDPVVGAADPERAFSGAEGEFVLALAHAPDVLAFGDQRADLLLVGHTHGGQVRLPLVGPLYVPSRFGARYSAGLYETSWGPMYVNRGLGWTGLPVRFLCPPEVTVVRLC
ncbi:MAG: metallophosphoesterase [Thermoproteota archaeon]|nr:MAG: metallophosphoesterase [Candidatus Korarchaeota archaeon]